MKKNIVPVLLLAALSACSGQNAKEQNTTGEERILNKSSFYLSCDKVNIKLECINSNLVNDEICSEYGYQGCDSKGIYTKIGDTWIMTSSKGL